MRWTRDGQYLVAASDTAAMAYDLERRQTVALEKTLSYLSQKRFAFVGADKLILTCDGGFKTGSADETYKMCLRSFAGGPNLSSLQFPEAG